MRERGHYTTAVYSGPRCRFSIPFAHKWRNLSRLYLALEKRAADLSHVWTA